VPDNYLQVTIQPPNWGPFLTPIHALIMERAVETDVVKVRQQTDSPRSWATRYSGDGVHLFNRWTGTNLLLEEIRVPRARWSSVPRHVSVALLNACDLSCAHCCAPKVPARLQGAVIRPWLLELGRQGCLGVGFGGGEPTLHPELPDLCRLVTAETPMAASITTHGHHLSRTLAAHLRGSVHFIRLSMDGMGDTYEHHRRRSFTDFLKHLGIARSVAPVGINYLVNGRTLHDIDRAIEFAEDHGVQEILLLPEQPTVRVPGIDNETLRQLQDFVGTYAGSVRLSISEIAAEGFPVCDPFTTDTGLRAYGHIDAHGRAKSSSFHSSGIQVGADGVVAAFTRLSRLMETNP